jgi:Flagellar hook-length control protein FliK
MISAQSVTSFSAVTVDGTNDKKSFADCLKETKDDSDKEDQTASTTSRPHTSPKRAASEKEPHRKTSGGASGPLATGDVPQTQILDPRSLILSWKKSGAEGGGKGRVASSAPAEQADGTAATNAAASALPKGQVAFGVSIPQNAAKPQAPQTPSANANAVTNLAAQNAQANTNGDSARGGHSNSNGGDSGDSSAPAPSVTASTQTKEADASAIAAPSAAATDLNSTIVQPVPTAYTQVDSMKSSTPVTAAAPVAAIDDPPAAPTLRPHSIEIQVPGAGGQQVDVRVSQRAGNVDVTVRTPDNEIAQSLRQHLPELSERLSQSGVNGDVWQPAAAASAETSNGNGSTSGDSQDQNWQGQQQNQQQARQQSDSQQNQRGSNWMNQFYSEQEGR